MFRWLPVVLLSAALLSGLVPAQARAQAYPTKPVRIIVPYPASGGNDIIARAIGQRLQERLGQPVLVENKPGGGTLIGAEAAARSPADGHTLFVGTIATMSINPSLYKEMPYDPAKDFAPVIHLVNYHMILVTHPSLPAQSVGELVAHAKANPGKVSYASFGNGSTPHLGTELLKTMTGIDMVHIPYKGGAPALQDLLGGQVGMMFIDAPPSIGHIGAGKIRALAVASPQRTSLLPNLPTVGETVPGFGFTSWAGLFTNAGTPPEIVKKLNAEIGAILKLPEMQEQFAKLGADPVGGAPEALGEWMRQETARWGKVVKDSGAKLD